MVHHMSPAEPVLHICADLEEASLEVARKTVELAQTAVATSGQFSIVLSGGNTPRRLHEILATDYRDAVPWADTHVFWGDERWVPHDHPDSNFRMADETLLRHVPIPTGQVHPMPTQLDDPEVAADAYQTQLAELFEGKLPRFDLILLGMGSDGHTASLFPTSAALVEATAWVMPSEAPSEPRQRLTLTLPVLNNAAYVVFLISGSDKRTPMAMALDSATDSVTCPAAAVRPHSGQLHFYVDQAASPA